MRSLRTDPPGRLSVRATQQGPRRGQSTARGRGGARRSARRPCAQTCACGSRARRPRPAGRPPACPCGPACRGRPCRACAGPWAPASAPRRPGSGAGPSQTLVRAPSAGATRRCAHRAAQTAARPQGAHVPSSGPGGVGLGAGLLRLLRRRRVRQEVRELFQQVPVRPEQQRDLHRMQQGLPAAW